MHNSTINLIYLSEVFIKISIEDGVWADWAHGNQVATDEDDQHVAGGGGGLKLERSIVRLRGEKLVDLFSLACNSSQLGMGSGLPFLQSSLTPFSVRDGSLRAASQVTPFWTITQSKLNTGIEARYTYRNWFLPCFISGGTRTVKKSIQIYRSIIHTIVLQTPLFAWRWKAKGWRNEVRK